MAADEQLDPQTTAVTAGRPTRVPGAEIGPPVSMTSTYVGAGATPPGQPFYGRVDNATWTACEEAIGALEGVRGVGDEGGALVFASGMAAIAAVLDRVPDGGLVVLPTAAYNTTLELADELAARGRVRARRVDVADTDAVRTALDETASGETPTGTAPMDPTASMLWLESPTNPLLEVADLAVCAQAARAVGAITVVDNTFATPLVQRPLDLGADVVVHSVTKFLSGHSDLVLGATVTRDAGLHAALTRHRRLHGAIPGPWESWLALRGIRTLGIRMERAQATAAELARRLSAHPAVERVRHPSLPADPGHERATAQMRGYGAVLAVEVHGGVAVADAVVDAVRLWLPATSLGGVESMIERRRRHGNESTTVPEALLRLSVGIEDLEDLWRDLDAALRLASPKP